MFAPAFKRFLQKACAIGRRREALADATIKAYARDLARELDRLLALKATQTDGRHLQASMFVDARDKLLVFLTRRDVEPTNNVSERALRPSVIFRKVTNGFRSGWGAKAYADFGMGRSRGTMPIQLAGNIKNGCIFGEIGNKTVILRLKVGAEVVARKPVVVSEGQKTTVSID